MGMSARLIQYKMTYTLGDQTAPGAALRELEAVLARLVAQAYLADHPGLLTEPPTKNPNVRCLLPDEPPAQAQPGEEAVPAT